MTRYREHIGVLLTPNNRNSVESVVSTGLPWAIDNGAFSGFNANAFMKLCLNAEGQPRLMWVACPDVVGDAAATMVQFERWHAGLERLGLPVAFVGQDGCETMEIPWESLSCLFLGGSTDWKLSNAAWDVCREAKRRGKMLHMGRVNSLRRMRVAQVFGCDTIDGSSASRFGDAKIPQYCRWLAHHIGEQPLLLLTAATAAESE